MRILHVSSAEVFGGIETILVSLARYRALCPELEHHFALCWEGRLSEELRALAAPVHMLGGARLDRPLSVRNARRALRAAIKQSACDVVICHGNRSMIFFAPTVRASRLPLVMWVHGVKVRLHWRNWLLCRVPPDLAICCSRYIQQALAPLFPSVESTVIYAPLALDADSGSEVSRSAVRRELGTPADAIVVVLAGRMVPLKGHRRLIDALADLRSEGSWRCWIVGGIQSHYERAYFNELKSQVRDTGLSDRIHFTGQRSDVPRILAAADLYCQPNLRAESFGVVFIEAMMAGLPVMTSAIGGALETIDQDSGILLPPNDQQALTEGLRSLLTDPGLRQRAGSGGPARARRICDPAAKLHDLRTALETLVASSLSMESTNPPTLK